MRWSDEHGLTVAELSVVLGLMVILVAAVFMIMQATSRMADSSSARSIASDEVRIASGHVVSELRQAQELEDGLGAFGAAEARRVVFFADIDHDGSPERVTYYVDGRAIKRTIAEPVSTPVGPATGWLADSAPETLLRNLDPAFTGAVFNYYSGGSSSTTLTGSSIPSIAMVRIHIVNAAHSGNVTATVEEAAFVKVRVVQSEVN